MTISVFPGIFNMDSCSGLSAKKDEKEKEEREPEVRCAQAARNQKNDFRLFDRDSHRKLNKRICQAKKDYGFVPHRVPAIADGAVLPKRFLPVPDNIYGRPTEEFDGVSFEKTFCVVSKRFSNNYVIRFSATRAIFIFTPWNPIRKAAIFIITNQYFDYLVILTIIVNCVFLALTNPIEEAEYVFLSIYTAEMVLKVISKGFVMRKYTYLRSPWNWLDFTVIVLGYITIFVEVGNLSGLRTFRVLRALKTVSILPGLNTIVNALLHSVGMLTEVMALTVFCLMVFALFGLQIFMGVLRNKCVAIYVEEQVFGNRSNHSHRNQFISDSSNWLMENEEYRVCGNATGAWFCPVNYTCLPDVGLNPNYGYTSFDNFGWAMMTSFQLVTLDFWEDIYNKIIATCGPSSVIFFVFVVFFGSFYLINLMLAVVAMSYGEEAANAEEEKRENIELKIKARRGVTISLPSSKRNLKAKGQKKNDGHESSMANGHHEVGNGVIKNNEIQVKASKRERNAKVYPFDQNTSDQIPQWIAAPIVYQTETYRDRNCSCCRLCCCGYSTWLKTQHYISQVVEDPFFELLITLCIIVNTMFLAAEHHGMSSTARRVLSIGNKVFTVIFTLEAVLKLLASSKEYFHHGWNIFDLIAITGSLIDLSFENFNGLSVLRAFRLLRIFKLAQSWTTMKILLSIILSTLGALGNLVVVLLIIMYIFAILGMQLFGSNYQTENFDPDPVPRWNFKDFPHAFLMIFRVLCGEWIEPMWDCMRSSGGNNGGQACIALFLPALIVGNFLVLNLFLAMLLSSFNSEQLVQESKKDDDISRLKYGIRRLKKLLYWCSCCSIAKASSNSLRTSNSIDSDVLDTGNSSGPNSISSSQTTAHLNNDNEQPMENWVPVVKYVDNLVNGPLTSSHQNGVTKSNRSQSETTLNSTSSVTSCSSSTRSAANGKNSFHSQTNGDVIDTAELPCEEVVQQDVKQPVEERWPEDCFPQSFYGHCLCCESDDDNKDRLWMKCRKFALRIVDHPAFEWIILVLIIASSISLCFEDVYLDTNKNLQTVLYYLNVVFTVLFTLEMLLKWLAHGFAMYFSNIWTILDFIIVLVSITSLVVENSANLTALRSMRTLRALRPLRAISRWQGMKIVVNALVSSIPSIINVLLVCVVFWLVFSIMGVQFFAGKFYKCVDDEGERLDDNTTANYSECLAKNYSWVNSNVNFDNVGQAYLALFQVATFEGWMEVMADAVDATGVDEQPTREANMTAYIYFIVFIIFGSFFTLNLFIGVIIDNFNMLKKRYEGGVLDMFLTDSQKNYYSALKKLSRKKPQKLIHRPSHRIQIYFYNLCMNRKFEIAVFIVIVMNMISMAVDHYKQPPQVEYTLEIVNIVFTAIFALEALIKMLAFRCYYFTVPWNIFDFALVVLSILGIVLRTLRTGFFISPTLLRVIRVFRIGRVLRLIKAAKGIRKLIFALVVSLPALFNIGALLFLIMFIYAIMGMSLFGYVKRGEGAINEICNFETFGNSMLLLFRLITSAGWSDIYGPLMIAPPDCDPHFRNLPTGDCGNPTFAVIFLVSYIVINYMIVINMYIAVILENFNQAHLEEEIGIVEDDIEMFYVNWANFDPMATQFISLNKVSDFMDSLDPPLRIPKPNIIALVSFNVPIARGNLVHCLDILRALIKKVLGHVDETSEFLKLQSQMEEKFKKQFPNRKKVDIVSSTMKWKREDVAARVLQKSFKRWQRRSIINSDTHRLTPFLIDKNSTLRTPQSQPVISRIRRLSQRLKKARSDSKLGPNTPISTHHRERALPKSPSTSHSSEDVIYVIPQR